MKIFFLLLLFLVFYGYFGYPLTLLILKLIRGQKKYAYYPDGKLPKISFIITAYNEQHNIEKKIWNSLETDYPEHLIEIIVASDCSTDKTDDIVRNIKLSNLHLVRNDQRLGKESAQKKAIEFASNDILVFSDASVLLEKSSIREIVKGLYDDSVGCVSSTDRIQDDDGKYTGENFYVKYEMFLRQLESDTNSLVGLSGSFFAAKKDVCKNWDVDLPSDFNVLLSSIEQSMVGIIDEKAIGIYRNIKSEKAEFSRKVRTILRGLNTIRSKFYLLNPFMYGFFSFQLFCHKVLRWMVPILLILIFICNAMLAVSGGIYLTIFALQISFYILAFLGFLFQSLRQIPIIKIPFFFMLVNWSILVSLIRFARGENITTWNPTRR